MCIRTSISVFVVVLSHCLVRVCLAQTSAIQAATAPASQPTATASASGPAESESTVLDRPGTDRVVIPVPGRPAGAAVWVHRPSGYAPGQRPPLVVCLHGTDDTAEEMIQFWRQRRMRFPAVLVAPQGGGKGWCSEDVSAIRAMFDWLPAHVWYDPNRVLLAGFSAGGAMTFQLAYKEKVPVTAAVAMANYVPPRLTAEEIRERRELPVFYAVGMTDVNHELMRAGLDFLRTAGGNVELYHPAIGHVLNSEVAQAGLDWFGEQCVRQTAAAIERASREAAAAVGQAAERMEMIVSQPTWHDAEQVARASEVLARLNADGERSLQEADRLASKGQSVEAIELLREVEQKYGISRPGVQARQRREKLEADPLVQAAVRQAETLQRADTAMSEYANAQKLVVQRRLADARQACRRIVEQYPETPGAERARRLLDMLEARSAP